MPEWLIGPVSKTGVPVRVPRVRIPLSPLRNPDATWPYREAGMASAPTSLPIVRGFGATSRKDRWWLQPLLVFLGLSTFIVYSTWAAFQGEHYTHGPYLSPFYS